MPWLRDVAHWITYELLHAYERETAMRARKAQ
jgi:hypothetical protein